MPAHLSLLAISKMWGMLEQARHTLDWLFREEVMMHCLNPRRQRNGLVDNVGKVLQDQASRRLRPLTVEFRKVVTNTATQVNQKDVVLILQACDQI